MNELARAIDQAVAESLSRITPAAREKLAADLHNWLALTAVKSPVPDLPERLEQWRIRLQEMAAELQVIWDGENMVIKANGQPEATLRTMERGSGWFEPCANVREVALATLLSA